MMPLPLFDNEKNALNPVFCKGEATFSHPSGGGILGMFFQLGHLDLLHTALSKSKNFFYKVDLLTGSDDRGVLGLGVILLCNSFLVYICKIMHSNCININEVG